MKWWPIEWEKILANDIANNRLIFKIYKELIQFNVNKTTQLKKCVEDLNRPFPKKTYRWPTGI